MPQARWTVPINFRERDKPVLDDILEIARNDRSDITNVVRNALAEYVKMRLAPMGESGKTHLDTYLNSPLAVTKVLRPGDLMYWQDSDLLSLAKIIRARREELEIELRRRGYRFSL